MQVLARDRRVVAADPTAPPGTGRRRPAPVPPRVLGVVIAGVLAMILTASVLADRRRMVDVAVAARAIPAGAQVTVAAVKVERLAAGSRLARSLVPFAEVAGARLVARHTIEAGEPIGRAAVSVGKGVGQRAVSIPVLREDAVGGDIAVGDQVDIIDFSTKPARYVLYGAEVVGRAATDNGLSSGSGGFYVTVVVTDRQALDVADAVHNAKVLVVRSTGAPPANSSPLKISETTSTTVSRGAG